MKSFEELLGKESPLLKSVNERGFEKPTEIQDKSIPPILEGKDVIAGASTGSGKTLAFTAGLLKNVEKEKGVQGLILTPTRELAEQISNELADFSRFKKLNILSVYGGVSIYNQVKRLKDCEIVVGTPGRILDHIQRNSIDLSRINTLVLDEADRMFDMGFRDDVERIISEIPNKRQTLLFSATITQDVTRLANKYLKKPVEISAKPHVDPKMLKQVYYDIDDNLKYSLLKHLLESEKSKLVLIFCNTRRNVDFISNNLNFMGFDTVPIHGGFSQDKRNKFLNLFNSNKVHILVATDVAARGLDIKGISHVYNYDIPPSKDEYTHRIGRTARAGKEGKVINILTSRGYEDFEQIVDSKEFNIDKQESPRVERVRIRWMPEKKFERNRRRSSMEHERSNRNWKSGPRRSGSRDGRSDDNKREGKYNRDDRRGGDSGRSGDRSRGRDDRRSGGSRGGYSRGGDDRGSRGRSSGGYSRDNDRGSSRGGYSRDSRGRDSGRSGERSYGNRDDRGSRGRSSGGERGRYSRDNDRRGNSRPRDNRRRERR